MPTYYDLQCVRWSPDTTSAVSSFVTLTSADTSSTASSFIANWIPASATATTSAGWFVHRDTYTTINQWFGSAENVFHQPDFGQTSNSIAINNFVWQAWNDAQVMSEEQRERLAQAQLLAQRRHEEATRVRAEAAVRAKRILEESLDPMQREEWAKAGHFHVVTKNGRRYRITRGTAGNVFLIEKEKPVGRYCIHPPDHEIPAEDVMLMQKLWLEAHESEFLRVANHSRIAA